MSSTNGAIFVGVPSFFLALCQEASRGGSHSYQWAGYELARHTAELLEGEDNATYARKLAELMAALAGPAEDSTVQPMDEAAVLAWYAREFPRCLSLVPRQRRSAFAEGIRECWEDGYMS
jgi:hypothetical protein